MCYVTTIHKHTWYISTFIWILHPLHYMMWNYTVSVIPMEEKSISESLSVVSNSLWPHGLYSPWNSPGQDIGVGSLSLLQRIVPTQGSNPGLPHYRWILYQLSHKGNPRIPEWITYPFSSGSSWPRNWTGISCFAGGFFTNWASKEAHGRGRRVIGIGRKPWRLRASQQQQNQLEYLRRKKKRGICFSASSQQRGASY